MCEKYNGTPKYWQERLNETTEGMKYVQYQKSSKTAYILH